MIQNAEKVVVGTEEACAKLWSVYISQAEKYDKALVAGWRADMKGILIFAGLFSSILTAFIIESYRTLSLDPANAMALIIAQISRQLNGSTEMPRFCHERDPRRAVVARLSEQVGHATVPHQAREDLFLPLQRSQVTSGPHPLLLHMSLLLFFAGLVMFLIPIDMAMALIAASILSIVATPCSLRCLYPSPTARAARRLRVFFGAPARRSGLRGAAACLVPIITPWKRS
ncbi:hypothetical protein DFH06DRAFT_991502 [Mycena polygramma]|nr:hypothetical protein DFH06DRAFT_991502 [Mycena polygramma]